MEDKKYQKLREMAEKRIQKKEIYKIKDEKLKRMIHELNVHQIELEIQNQQLRDTQEQLEKTRDELQELYDFAPVGYSTMDAEGVITHLNHTLAELIGLPRKNILHTEFYDYLDEDDKDDFFLHLRHLFKKSTNATRSTILKLNASKGGERIVHLKSLLRDNGLYCWTAVIDVTEKKMAQKLLQSNKKLKQSNEELAQKIWELENSNSQLEAFNYSASHDLRAPLRSIHGFSELLIEEYQDKLDDEGKHYLSRILKSVEKMTALIEALLELSRIHRKELENESVNLSKLAEEIVSDLSKKDPDRDITVDIKPDLKVNADRELMKIMLRNLFNNAWKFTKNNDNPTITFGKRVENDEIVFFVRDNGVGFDNEFADKAFVPFQRLHDEDEFLGTGIGLAIVNRIIRHHNGKIWCEGEEGKGATFFFTIC